MHRHTGRLFKRAGVDITANVNSRMVPPEARAMLAKGGPASDRTEKAIISRLSASLRDEAIWQYHIGGRGLVFWCVDHTFRYLRRPESGREEWVPRRFQVDAEISTLLDTYDPSHEALVLAEYLDSVELLHIKEDATLTLLKTESLDSPKNCGVRNEGGS
jgi:hypothetical protein